MSGGILRPAGIAATPNASNRLLLDLSICTQLSLVAIWLGDPMRRRDLLKFGAAGLSAPLLPRAAWAQGKYPERPVRLIVPPTVKVHYVDLTIEIERLSYYLK